MQVKTFVTDRSIIHLFIRNQFMDFPRVVHCALHSNKLLSWQIKQIIQQRILFFISSIFQHFAFYIDNWQLVIEVNVSEKTTKKI